MTGPRRRVMLLSDDHADPDTALCYRWVAQQYDPAADEWCVVGFGDLSASAGEAAGAGELYLDALWLEARQDEEAAREIRRME